MDLNCVVRAIRQRAKSVLIPCPIYRLLPDGMAQIKGLSSHQKRSQLKAELSILNNLIKKTSQMYSAAWFSVKSRFSHADDQE